MTIWDAPNTSSDGMDSYEVEDESGERLARKELHKPEVGYEFKLQTGVYEILRFEEPSSDTFAAKVIVEKVREREY